MRRSEFITLPGGVAGSMAACGARAARSKLSTLGLLSASSRETQI
jgi:hypothetical protein